MKFLLCFVMLCGFGCDAFSFSQRIVKVPEKVEAPKEVVTPTPAPVGPVLTIDSIKQVAAASTCASYRWKDRGVAPKGYMKGMALVFARTMCNPDAHKSVFTASGLSSKDALAHYGKLGSATNTFALLIGLGTRESSGGLNCGRDATASNTAAESAESGTFQTSYDSKINSEQAAIYEDFKQGRRSCFKEVFTEDVSCKPAQLKNWGTGEGVTFQKLSKECPAFAAEYAATTIRVLRGHYGPLNRKEAEYRLECESMLNQVKMIIEQQPEICKSL